MPLSANLNCFETPGSLSNRWHTNLNNNINKRIYCTEKKGRDLFLHLTQRIYTLHYNKQYDNNEVKTKRKQFQYPVYAVNQVLNFQLLKKIHRNVILSSEAKNKSATLIENDL